MTAGDFPPDYNARIERVCEMAAVGLRKCRGDLLAQLRVCCDYFNQGEAEGISHGELVDFLGISARSVLDRAGYSAEEAMGVMEGIALIRTDPSGRLVPPASLPAPKSHSKEKQSPLDL